MKACDNCGPANPEIARVCIGKRHSTVSPLKQFLGVCVIYLPIATLPFVFASAYLSYWHLKLMGAENLKTFSDFLPARNSFRYNFKNQITMKPSYGLSPTQTRLFWILNCTAYCPVSVAVFEWHAYLVKIVENWWCPFQHDKKDSNYREGAIDLSFWHIYPEDVTKLDPADRDNPIWNENAEQNRPADDKAKADAQAD